MPTFPTFCPGAFTPVLTPMYSDEDEVGENGSELRGFLVNPDLDEDDFFVQLALKQPQVAFPLDLPSTAPPASDSTPDDKQLSSTPDNEEGTFCGFPLSEKDSTQFQVAFFLGVTDFPISFGCGLPEHFDLDTLVRCPCFAKSLGPVQLSYLRDKFDTSWVPHECGPCAWCSRCPKMPTSLVSLCSGNAVSVYRQTHTPEFLRFLASNTKVTSCSLAPLSPVDVRRISTIKTLPFKPRVLHGLSIRFFDSTCPRGCPEPLRASPFARNRTFEEYCRHFGAYGHPRVPADGPTELVPWLLLLALLFLVLLLAILTVAVIALLVLLFYKQPYRQ